MSMTKPASVTYQVTLDGTVDSEHPNGYLADLEAKRLYTSRRARGLVVAIKRSDGKVPYTSSAF